MLSLLSIGSAVARALWIDQPNGRGLIFDEKYYVNAARRLAGFAVPCGNTGCDPYMDAPVGTDGNSEHPPLGKLFIAAGMKVFGDTQLGWRIAPLIFGTLAIAAMYWVVRSAGGSGWLSLGAASLMATDNQSLVHGRIATLDVFVVVFMLVCVALYLRGHPVLAGIALGVGGCVKLVAPFALAALVLLEVARFLSRREWHTLKVSEVFRERLFPLLYCGAAAVVVYLGLLTGLDHWVSPVHNPSDPCPGSGTTYANAFVHTRFMWCYANKLTNPEGATGIASYPWQWLGDVQWINYYSVEANGDQKVQFLGVMNPAIIFLAVPGFLLATWRVFTRHDDITILAVAWCVATFAPFQYFSAVDHRISYLYYMVVVLPGIYLSVAMLIAATVRWLRGRHNRFLRRFAPTAVATLWTLVLAGGFYFLYPIRTWTGG